MARRASVVAVALTAAALAAGAAPAAAGHPGDRNCSDFATQAGAQQHMNAHPGDPDGLDHDDDGIACETNSCPCDHSSATEPGDGTAAPRARRHRARVVRVIDGDTLKVRLKSGRRRTVRLIGIDTPETRRPGTPAECGGRQATRAMRRLATRKRRGRRVGRVVRLVTDPSQGRIDRYGRALAYVERKRGGRDLGRAMVARGWAAVYVHGGRPFRRHAAYAAAQDRAREAERGVWGRCAGDLDRG